MRRINKLVNFPVYKPEPTRALRVRQLGLALLLILWVYAAAAAPATKQILILNSFDPHALHNALTAEVFRDELERRVADGVSFTEMNLDARWNTDAREPLVAELLRRRQSYLPLDLVFAEGPPAIAFWLKYRDAIAPDAAFVATARQGTFEPDDFRPGDVSFWSDFSFRTALEDIRAVQPETNEVLIVLGSSEVERELTRQAQRELADYPEIAFDYTNDMSIDDLQHRIQTLGPRSAIYLAIFNTDVNRTILRGHAALSLAHAISPAPIFGPFDDQLGHGIVGGRLIPLTQLGQRTAAAAAEMLAGTSTPEAWQPLRLTPPTYDQRELQRWSIDESRLPPDSEIRFARQPIWAMYPGRTALLVAFVLAQGLLIVALLTQRRRARQAERSQRRLAGMLIDSHEDEHRRIARELHDDLSQRLARLAIDTGRLSHAAEHNGMREPLQNLGAEIGSIAEDVHDLSYRLHPSIVDDLGIVPALRTECDRVRRNCSTRIVEDIEPLTEALPRDIALGVYRICQEALANAIRHANAATIAVHFARSPSGLTLEIRDDGRGLDPDAAGSGLGLSSMLERARLLGGTLVVESAPGGGTTVRATLPLTRSVSPSLPGSAQ